MSTRIPPSSTPSAPPPLPHAPAESGSVAFPPKETFEQIRRTLTTRERRVIDPPRLRPAAVLVPLFEADGDLHVLLTLRTETVGHHKGQVSFPGGGRHDDDHDLLATALRESHEEIGLPASQVEVLGALDDVPTISSFQVTPWVARITWPVALVASPDETAEIFSVPLQRLLDPTLCRLEERTVGDRRYYPVHHFTGGKHVIWGLTGHILARLLEVAFNWRHPDLDPARVSLRWEH